MKYHNLAAFEKHLEQTPPSQLSSLYLVVSACPSERKRMAGAILRALLKKEPALKAHAKEAANFSIEKLLDELNTLSLFSEKQMLYLDGFDKLKKPVISSLTSYAERPNPFTYLVLGANSLKPLNDLYSEAKKEMIVCDLTQEKPWERKERFKRALMRLATKWKKRFDADALEYLLEHAGQELSRLEQEAMKLINYIAEEESIRLRDVQKLCPFTKEATLWQMAEAIVWQAKEFKLQENFDLASLLPLIAQMRTQLQQGLTIATLRAQGFAGHEIAQFLPTLKSATLEKRLESMHKKGPSYFMRGLELLFEMEFAAKNSSVRPDILLTLFQTKFCA